MSRTQDEAGMTLVEIVVALLLLGVVLTAFFRVITGGLQSLSDSGQRQDASQLTTESIETLRSLAPSEVALKVDPMITEADEVDVTALSNCVAHLDDDGDGTSDRTAPGYFDPDAGGMAECEELVTNPQGAVTSTVPFNGTKYGVDITTVPTLVSTAGVQSDVTRVTTIVTYELQDGVQTIRRQAYFSEVSRG